MTKDDGSTKKGNWKKVENNPDKRPLPIYIRSSQGMVNVNDAKSETQINRGY